MYKVMPKLFDSAINSYLNEPTRENYQQLLEAAEDYRDLWIAAQASAKSSPIQKSVVRESKAKYERELEVTESVDDIPVKLALQERTKNQADKPWWVLSWRTKYSPDSSNRRFYMTKDGCWTIPAKIALDMIQQLEALGGLSDKYFDHRVKQNIETLVSTDMSLSEKEDAFAHMTAEDEDWGSEPFFVINSDPHEDWKKVMIVNTDDDVATFRSITTNSEYMPKKVLRPNEGWWVDNSMMDANVQQMRQFYKHLGEYFER